ncbi:maleylacetoacetate isomerase [Wenzhouxiangella sediminis]|uniref:Maleylacetoacetate isomerase n=2 Tax=Wenzhouxiangella sediminis TaxID=1792836 RepID=A0A3E1KAJ6_9GAMM|nr:maleylacetoacetate isomerase [Wenzhouxiangella sediminis]
MVLYSYWRSSASYRVRMALKLKGLDHEIRPVHLVRDGGEQFADDYTALNPQQLVPTLIDGETVITQSMAMLEYLEERHPEPALLPGDHAGRARVRAIAQAIACEIHPLNNLRVLKYLTGTAGLDEDAKLAWYRHWTETGLAAVERMLDNPGTGRFCHGDEPGLADCCLLPQVYNAERFECNIAQLKRIRRICEALGKIPAVVEAMPENQPDAA